jgi:hypothetical protein
MATTHTVTSPASGDLLYSFTALADGDTFDIDASAAKSILFQVTGGTYNSSTVALTGSLNGTNFAPLFGKQQLTTGVAVTTAVSATASNQTIWDVQPTRIARVAVTGGTGTGLTCNVLIRTLHG